MSAVIIENTETGERRVLEPCAKHNNNYHMPKGWRAVTTVRNEQIAAARAAAWANYPFKKCSSCGELGVYEYG